MPKGLAPKELVKVFEGGEKTLLPLWDPMVRLTLHHYNIIHSEIGQFRVLWRERLGSLV